MPLYEYKCNNCNVVFSIFYKTFSEIENPEKIICYNCNTYSVERIMSASSFVLHGDGWYMGTKQKEEREKK